MKLNIEDLRVSVLDNAVLHLICHVARSRGVINRKEFF